MDLSAACTVPISDTFYRNRNFSQSDALVDCHINIVKTGLELPSYRRNCPCSDMPIFRTQLERLRHYRKCAEDNFVPYNPYVLHS